MDSIRFEISEKNIPIPAKEVYQKMLINAVGTFSKNLTWAAFFFLNPQEKPPMREWFGFKSLRAPPIVKELDEFKDSLSKLVQTVEFNKNSNQFLKSLDDNLKDVHKEKKVYVPADKTNNKYLLDPAKYNELLEKNVQSQYKKADSEDIDEVTSEHQQIVKDLEMSERVFETVPRAAFITLKDHKENFQNNPQVRVLNPTKCEIGKISKKILERIVKQLRKKLKLKQWQNTDAVIEWFKALSDKKKKRFIQLDIESFYPSITPELLDRALEWAETHVEITTEEKNVIRKAKQSFLYTGNTPWVKKGGKFDVSMGAFDGAESSDLIGLFLLHLIETEIKDVEIGLYRDDGLCVTSATPRLTEKLRQKIVKIFKDNNLGTTSTANLTQVQFLDVTLDLKNEIFKPYIKPGDKPTYVHSKSNHPPSILQNIPLSINKRLSKISANKDIFDATAPIYQAELKKNGYNHTLEFDPTATTNKRRTRTRKVIYFNPPYSINVKTNIGAKFLRLIDHHFPPGSTLHPLVNRKKVKLSYRCLPNLKSEIAKHNFKILNQENPNPPPVCNCQDKSKCPLPGKCTIKSLVYRATVRSTEEKYVGLTANTFKQRYGGHKANFSNPADRTKSTLAGHIWSLKDQNEEPELDWEVVCRAAPFSSTTGVCNLCTSEKWHIIYKPENATLNRRQELFNHCRHKERLLLVKNTRRLRKNGS